MSDYLPFPGFRLRLCPRAPQNSSRTNLKMSSPMPRSVDGRLSGKRSPPERSIASVSMGASSSYESKVGNCPLRSRFDSVTSGPI